VSHFDFPKKFQLLVARCDNVTLAGSSPGGLALTDFP
jgi:hypothetical protein